MCGNLVIFVPLLTTRERLQTFTLVTFPRYLPGNAPASLNLLYVIYRSAPLKGIGGGGGGRCLLASWDSCLNISYKLSYVCLYHIFDLNYIWGSNYEIFKKRTHLL